MSTVTQTRVVHYDPLVEKRLKKFEHKQQLRRAGRRIAWFLPVVVTVVAYVAYLECSDVIGPAFVERGREVRKRVTRGRDRAVERTKAWWKSTFHDDRRG